MRNIFKRNQEPIVAPATTTATVSPGLLDNSTESGGAGPSKDDLFTYVQDKFFNQIQSIPCECPRGPARPVRVPPASRGKGRCQHPDTRALDRRRVGTRATRPC
ncbi:SYT2 [Vulpes lagopus]